MFYPLKFEPLYKDYIWGGRNLEKIGKILPEGIVAESWEVSCHPDGVSIIANGEFKGLSLPEFIRKFGRRVVGTALPEKDVRKFPLLVKFIDANDDLSVQVHPDDNYALTHENGEYGKNEMWYVICAEPGAKLIYDVIPGTTREILAKAIKENKTERYLKTISVVAGDVINIPAGLVHAVCRGIMLAEIQQNSNTTYRIYDYNRRDKNGNLRPLHINKALDVISFDSEGRREKYRGLKVNLTGNSTKTYLAANSYFSAELYDIKSNCSENADGSKFYMFTFIEGEGKLTSDGHLTDIKAGESILIPAFMGEYHIEGNLKAIKSYVPDIEQDVINPLKKAGYTKEDIEENVGGLRVAEDMNRM